MFRPATVIGFICSLALVGGGIALGFATGSSVAVVLIVVGALSIILVSVFAVIGAKPRAERQPR